MKITPMALLNWAERYRDWVKRNRVLVQSGVAVVLVLIIGLNAYQWLRSTQIQNLRNGVQASMDAAFQAVHNGDLAAARLQLSEALDIVSQEESLATLKSAIQIQIELITELTRVRAQVSERFWKQSKARVKEHMTPAQLELGDPIVNSVGMVLVPIPAGEFLMGSPASDIEANSNEKPQHLVRITKPYYLSVYEVTQRQYENVMGYRPVTGLAGFGDDLPARFVSWNEAFIFCQKLSKQEGVDFRLPTEAQWEYACRAGTATVFSFGDDVSKLEQDAWHLKHAWQNNPNVGQKLPNPWGLYDMHGNVSEWCQDRYAPYSSEKNLIDPVGPSKGKRRVRRGGSIFSDGMATRSALRGVSEPQHRLDNFGFRVARTYP